MLLRLERHSHGIRARIRVLQPCHLRSLGPLGRKDQRQERMIVRLSAFRATQAPVRLIGVLGGLRLLELAWMTGEG